MASMPSSSIGKPVRKRAAAACSFCRKRKFKCDNGKPRCSHCETYGKECVFEQGKSAESRSAPSQTKLARLEEEVRKLRASLIRDQSQFGTPQRDIDRSRHSPQPSPDNFDASGPSSPSHEPELGSERHISRRAPSEAAVPAVSRIFVSAKGESSYHGPTSTLYDDTLIERRVANDRRPSTTLSHDWIQKGLFAEAAHQRHMETINYAAGKLDFDGVDPELGMHLLQLHWNRQHHSFLITYRPAFMRDMACNGPYFSKLLLNAIYFGSSKFSNRIEVRKDPDDARSSGWRFRQRTKELLVEALEHSEIPTIQALLVMTSSLFALGDERSSAWVYAGIALRMIVDLGLHVDAALLTHHRRLSDEDLEIRRRVFWGAFVVDKIQSLYQGRPASIQETDTRVPITFLDRYEELEQWAPFAFRETQSYASSPAYSVTTFVELCKLCLIMNRIMNKVYTENSATTDPDKAVEDLNSLHSELMAWHNGLPAHLAWSPNSKAACPPPHVLSLLAMYNVLLILLHRPFVSEGHLATQSVASNAFGVCTIAATDIVRLLVAYDNSFSIKRAPYLISYATYVAATIHVRIAAQKDVNSEAHTYLAACLKVFKQNQETNAAVRRAHAVINNLMKKLKVDIHDDEHAGLGEIVRSNESTQRMGPAGDPHTARTAPMAWNRATPSTTRNHAVLDGSLDLPTPTSELDMEVIIQSFMHDQPPAVDSTQYPVAQQIPSAQWAQMPVGGGLSSLYPSQMTGPVVMDGHIDQGLWQGNGFDNVNDYVFADTLFGFNSAVADGHDWNM